MWPQLFGAGSDVGLLVAGGLLAALVAIVCYAMRTARPMGPDPVADLWRSYEQGDITSWEAARLFQTLAVRQASVEGAAARRRGEPVIGTDEFGRELTSSYAAARAAVLHDDFEGV